MSVTDEDIPLIPETGRVCRNMNYLRSLMIDSAETDWPTARAAHKHVLNGLLLGRLKWEDERACLATKSDAIHRVIRIANTTAPKPQPECQQ